MVDQQETEVKEIGEEKNTEEVEKKNEKVDDKEIKRNKKEQLISDIYLISLIFSLFIIIIGIFWAIKDIFTETAYESFLETSLSFKILVIAIFLIGMVFLSLFLFVLYKRGRKTLLKKLFLENEPKNKKVEEYLAAKIIAGGFLIFIFIIFIGLIIASIEYLVTDVDTSGIWGFIDGLTGGTRILLIGFMVLFLVCLIIVFHYIWQNGYYYFMNQILKYNRKYEKDFSYEKNQKIISQSIFGIIVINVIFITISIVWAILDALAFTWSDDFSNYPFGIQFSFIGLLATGLFLVLICTMMLYKWGLAIISKSLFGEKKLIEKHEDNLVAKILTIFILFSIVLIVVSLIIWLSSLIAGAISNDLVSNLFVAINDLSLGLKSFSYSGLLFVIIVLVLMFVYLLKNGYYHAYEWLKKTQKNMEESLDKVDKKNQNEKSDK